MHWRKETDTYRITCFAGLIRWRFQGIGLMLSFDDPTFSHDNAFHFELRLLWFKAWAVVHYN